VVYNDGNFVFFQLFAESGNWLASEEKKKKSYLNGIAMMLMLMSTFLNLDQRFILFMLEGTNMERERNKNRSTEKQKIKQTS
jgi:hypothetical protein